MRGNKSNKEEKKIQGVEGGAKETDKGTTGLKESLKKERPNLGE